MAVMWRCSECETMNTEDKCIICGCSKPKTINNTSRPNIVQEQLIISDFNQESLKSVQNSNQYRNKNQYKIDNQQDSINSVKTHTSNRKKKNKKIPIIIVSCITVIFIACVSSFISLDIIKNYVDSADKLEETLPSLTTISTTKLDMASAANEITVTAAPVSDGETSTNEDGTIKNIINYDNDEKTITETTAETTFTTTKTAMVTQKTAPAETTTASALATPPAKPKQEYVMVGNYKIPTDITELKIYGSKYPFSETSIEEKHIYVLDKPLTDISFISEFTELVSISLRGHNISDISPLAGLTNLEELWLLENSITDISPLTGLTNLKKISLGQNNISDISPLVGLTNLNELYLYNNNISDISTLTGLTNLDGINLSHNSISNISPLTRLTNLDWLDLQDNNISDISPLAGLTNLRNLYLQDNNISDISSLARLTNLKELYLGKNYVDSDNIPSLQKSLPNCDIQYN